MKKNSLIGVMLLSLILIMTACGSKAESGMNEINLKELEKKLDNEESFLLVTFSASEDEVDEYAVVEAFDLVMDEMKKNVLIGVMLLLLILIMTACGSKAEIGMNEINLKELEKKLDNEESFLLVTFSASEDEVEESEVVEAFDQAFYEKEKTAFYVN